MDCDEDKVQVNLEEITKLKKKIKNVSAEMQKIAKKGCFINLTCKTFTR